MSEGKYLGKYPKTGLGSCMFQNWPPIRKAIEQAYQDIGEPVPKTIDNAVWNLTGAAILAYEEKAKPLCGDCKKPMDPGGDYRCYDCGWVMCKSCAYVHLWPNGRPKEIHHA